MPDELLMWQVPQDLTAEQSLLGAMLVDPNCIPEVIEQVRAERERLRYRRRYRQTLRSTVNVLIVVAALAVLAATVLTPVLQIYGSSMTPTLSEGDIVVSLKGAEFQPGELIAFYL